MRPRANADPAPVVASTAKPVAPAPVVVPAAPAPVTASSIPAPAVSAAPVRREQAVVEPKTEQPKVVLSPEQLRANAEQRATMSLATADRTPSLPKAATVTLHVQSLPADQFPPGYTPNRAPAQVNVAAGAAVANPVATPTVPAAAVPRQAVPAAPAVPGSRAGTPVVAVAPTGDSSPRAALPAPPPTDRDSAAETLSEISFTPGSSQLSPAATQQLRQLANTISSRLSGSPGLTLRLSGRRRAGEAADVETGRGLALRKAFIDEGIDDARIQIVVTDGPAASTGDHRVAVQLVGSN